MDADFMNAKEMKYNVERKKITFTWMGEEEEKLHTFWLLFIHDLLLFIIQHMHNHRFLHNHSLTIFGAVVDVWLLLLLCLEKILDIFEERGSRGSRKYCI